MNDKKKTDMFAKLAQQQVRSESAAALADETPSVNALPSPAPVVEAAKSSAIKNKPLPPKGKRNDPDYCQANAYLPKKLRRAVDRALLDMEGVDYSSLLEELLRKWVKSRGVSE